MVDKASLFKNPMTQFLKHHVVLSLAVQQILIGLLGLAFSIVIFQHAQLDLAHSINKLQIVLFAFAIGCLLQVKTLPLVGSGLFLPPISGAVYVQSCMIAVDIGGIPLMSGMVIFAGLCEFLFSFSIQRSRFLFPPETCGLVILLVGMELGVVGFKVTAKPDYMVNIMVFLVTLLPIIIFSVWGRGYIRHICSFIGFICGSISVMLFTHLPFASPTVLKSLPYFALPQFDHLWSMNFAFDWALGLPFLLVAFAASLRTIGLAISVQQFENKSWRRPHYNSIHQAIRSDSLTCMVAGLLGVNGINVSPTATILAIASQYTHKKLAIAMALGFLFLACIPKLLYFISMAPMPMIGAVLMYYASFIFTGGIRTIGTQSFGLRQIYSVGIPFSLAVSTLVFPAIYQQLPYPLNVLGRSALSMGMIAAVLLNLFFHLGSIRRKTFKLIVDDNHEVIISDKLYQYGEAWRLENNLIENSILIAKEITTQLVHNGLAEKDILIRLEQTAEAFKLIFTYTGTPFRLLNAQRGHTDKNVDEEMVIEGLKSYLSGTYPDEVMVKANNNTCTLTLTFHHF